MFGTDVYEPFASLQLSARKHSFADVDLLECTGSILDIMLKYVSLGLDAYPPAPLLQSVAR